MTVALEPRDGPGDRYEPLLQAAIDYWNGPGREYAKSDLKFVFSTGPPTRADVVVRVIESVSCNGRQTAVGCAPVVSPGDRIDGPVIVTVEAGYTDASTLTIIEHELGHVVGIGHDEPPVAVMSTNRTLVRLDENESSGQGRSWGSPRPPDVIGRSAREMGPEGFEPPID